MLVLALRESGRQLRLSTMSLKVADTQRLMGNGLSGSRTIFLPSLLGVHINMSPIRGIGCTCTALMIGRCSRLWGSTVLKAKTLRNISRSSRYNFAARNTTHFHINMFFPGSDGFTPSRGAPCQYFIKYRLYEYCEDKSNYLRAITTRGGRIINLEIN
jgi:hypothetical protein